MTKPTDDKRLAEIRETLIHRRILQRDESADADIAYLLALVDGAPAKELCPFCAGVGGHYANCEMYKPPTAALVDGASVRESAAREEGFKDGLKAASEHGWEWGGDASGVFWCKCRKWNEDMVPTWEQHIAELPVTEIASRGK